jgi:uncharacterized protein YkwD
MKGFIRPLVAFALLAGAGCWVVHAGAGTKGKGKLEMSAEEKELLELTNKEREKAKLPPLRASPRLWKIARAHSANMAKQGKPQHVLDGKTPFQRLKEAGYLYTFAGENVARGGDSLQEVMKGWMDSKGHRENILRRDFREIGVACVLDDDGVPYYTQLFATPRQDSDQ